MPLKHDCFFLNPPVGQGGGWEIKNSLNCGSGQIRIRCVLLTDCIDQIIFCSSFSSHASIALAQLVALHSSILRCSNYLLTILVALYLIRTYPV